MAGLFYWTNEMQYLSPIGNDQFIDANGDPLTGGEIFTYLAGSSTPAATYTSSAGVTPQSNPIVLNSLGYPTLGPIWLTGGLSYKFIIKDSDGATLRTIDNIAGVNDATLSQSEWLESGFVPTYIGATSFSVPGDQTGLLQVNRRLRTTNTAGLVYSTITDSVFAAGNTTVTLLNDGVGVLDAGLSLVAYALLAANDSSVPAIPVARFTMSTNRILGRDTASTGAVEELTAAEVIAMLGGIQAFVPTGAVWPFAMTTAPSGWLALPTTATNVSRTTYAALFAAIGTQWGAGDGSTTFGLPYLPEGYSPLGTASSVAGTSVGQVIAHTHGYAGDGISVTGGGQGVLYWGAGSNLSSSTGGSANLAAGIKFRWCIKL